MQKSFPREKQCRERGAMGALPVATELPPAFQATPLASAGGKETECINAFPTRQAGGGSPPKHTQKVQIEIVGGDAHIAPAEKCAVLGRL